MFTNCVFALFCITIYGKINAGQTESPIGRNLVPNRSGCGFQETQPIVEGNITSLDEFPWVAYIERINPVDGTSRYLCSGSLISKRYIVTAAYCVDNRRKQFDESHKINIRLGEWDTRQDKDCLSNFEGEICNDAPQNFDVEKVIVHEKYSPSSKTKLYDIALVKLSSHAKFTEFVRPICLPLPSEESRGGEELTVSGWGTTEYLGDVPTIKLRVPVKTTTNDECSAKYNERTNHTISSSQICAVGYEKGKNVCQGFGGAPLMRTAQNDSSQWYLEGIVSYGVGCGTSIPDVYTRVSSYLEWIYNNIEA